MTDSGPKRIRGSCAALETYGSISWVGPALSSSPLFNPSDRSGTWRPMCLESHYVRCHKSTQSDSPHPKEFCKPKKSQAFYSCKCLQFGCVYTTFAFHFCKYSPKQASWQQRSEQQLVSGKKATQFSSKQILNLHALVHLPISANWINEGKESTVQPRCPGKAAHTQPVNVTR